MSGLKSRTGKCAWVEQSFTLDLHVIESTSLNGISLFSTTNRLSFYQHVILENLLKH